MSEHIAHPTDENLRIKITLDEYPWWPEAACKGCGEGIVNDVNHGWVCDGVPHDQRERYTHCVTGVMMHTRGPRHEPQEK